MFATSSGDAKFIFIDVDDDTIIEVNGYQQQGSGYSKVRGLNAFLSTASRENSAPVFIALRLHKVAENSARAVRTFVTEALGSIKLTKTPGPVVCRFNSADFGHPSVSSALAGSADVTDTVPMNNAVKRAITTIAANGEDTQTWVSAAELAGIPLAAVSS